MKIYPPRENETEGTLENLKNCSNYKRVPKERIEMISFLEEMQNTLTFNEAKLINNLRRMPYILFLEQMKIFHNINRLFNQKNAFYRDFANFIENDFKED